MTLPDDVAQLIGDEVRPDVRAQAFPFLTVDDEGAPHVALLSGVELEAAGAGELFAVVAGAGTRANLLRGRRATLVAVGGTTVHTVKLALRRSVELEGVLGATLDVTSHKADSLGIELEPIRFTPSDELAQLERWDRSARVLSALRRS